MAAESQKAAACLDVPGNRADQPDPTSLPGGANAPFLPGEPSEPLSCRAQTVTDVPPPFEPEGTRGRRVFGRPTSRTRPTATPHYRAMDGAMLRPSPGPRNLKKRIASHGIAARL